jgi:hypothetical protein
MAAVALATRAVLRHLLFTDNYKNCCSPFPLTKDAAQ